METFFNTQSRPCIKITQELLKSVILPGLPAKMTLQKLVGKLYSKHEGAIDFLRLCEGKRAGGKISLLFNPHRLDTPTTGSCSLIEAWNTSEGFKSALARVVALKAMAQCSASEVLHQALQMGLHGIHYVFEFPPYVARDHFQSLCVSHVLDPCAGWGGRMIGAACVGASYTACEPATQTYEGLCKLGAWLKQFNPEFKFRVINAPFEDVSKKELGTGFDIAYTSPPYYDTELYSEEETNSCQRYATFEAWLDGFYIPMIDKAVALTRRGFILNVGCRRYDLLAPLKRYVYREMVPRLSGIVGLGRKPSGKESFYHVKGIRT